MENLEIVQKESKPINYNIYNDEILWIYMKTITSLVIKYQKCIPLSLN